MEPKAPASQADSLLSEPLWKPNKLVGQQLKQITMTQITIIHVHIYIDILSAALSQHHVLEFETAQLEFHHLHSFCS